MFAVIGICYDLPAGNISISLNLATVHDASLHVGYATTASRLFVEEVGQGTWSGGKSINYNCVLIKYNVLRFSI